jgi:hypothetical protein
VLILGIEEVGRVEYLGIGEGVFELIDDAILIVLSTTSGEELAGRQQQGNGVIAAIEALFSHALPLLTLRAVRVLELRCIDRPP